MLLQITDVSCKVRPQRPLLSSAITPWLYPTWLLYQLFSSPGISVVPGMASCLPAETLWEGQDSKNPSMSSGSHLPCLSLWSPFFTSFMPSHIPPVETSFLPPSLLPPGHHSLLSALFSPVTPHVLWGPALLLAQPVSHHQQKMPMAPLHQCSPSCSLRGSGDQGVGAETISIGASLAKDAAACWRWMHLWCMWYVPSSTLWWHWEWASPQSPWQYQQTSFSSLHWLFAHSTSLPGCLRGPAEPGQGDLKVSYRSSPQVSSCGCPSNYCLKPSSAGMLARSRMMGRFLVHWDQHCHPAQYFSAPLSLCILWLSRLVCKVSGRTMVPSPVLLWSIHAAQPSFLKSGWLYPDCLLGRIVGPCHHPDDATC